MLTVCFVKWIPLGSIYRVLIFVVSPMTEEDLPSNS